MSNENKQTKAKKITSGKKSTNKNTSDKTKAENDKHKKLIQQCYDSNYIYDLGENFMTKNLHEKCGNVLSLYILETIDKIQKNEVLNGLSEDNYPSSKYLLLNDKLMNASTSRKKKINTTNSLELPKQKHLPKKKYLDDDEDEDDEKKKK